MKHWLKPVTAFLYFFLGALSAAWAQQPEWPRTEYGTVQFVGQRQYAEGAAGRRTAQQRLLTWFNGNLQETHLVEGGRLSGRGEFYGWGSFAPIEAGPNSYQFAVGVGAQLTFEGELTFRVEDIRCFYRHDNKTLTVPLESLLDSRSPAHQAALVAFRKRLDEFFVALQ